MDNNRKPYPTKMLQTLLECGRWRVLRLYVWQIAIESDVDRRLVSGIFVKL